MQLKETLENLIKQKIIIEIYGLGYVGFPLAVKLSKEGITIHGIDVNKNRIERLKNNELLDSELNLKKEFVESRINKKLEINTSPSKTDLPKIGIICVPTPIPNEKIQSDMYVKSAVESFLNTSKPGDVIILESSIEVGTTENMIKLIESKGLDVGTNFGVCFCPERIDPANKEWGIENIPRVIYCSDDDSFLISKEVYKFINGANLIRVDSPKIAEVVKSFENAFRLVNISLVNELAMLCDKLKINVKDVIDAAATKPFGFMPHYPGAGAGGHCIPKDPRFLLESAKKFQTNFATIENALKINSQMPNYIADSIEKSLSQKKLEKSVIICGLSYKPNVEDMRDSASFKIISDLKKKNFKVFGYDPYFSDESIEKYLIENNLNELNFEKIENLNNEKLKGISCLCVVQHHDIVKERISEIYKEGTIPLIYDCQHKISKESNFKSILEFLGE
jgi:UDP-N-acetyl-D-glucosamine dehydrogenase